MSVQYVQITPISQLFSPVVRAFGNIAIIGKTTTGSANTPVFFTTTPGPNDQVTFDSDLGSAINLAFQQIPGPSLVCGVPVASTGTSVDWASALTTVSNLDVQIVVLANTPTNATNIAASSGSVPTGPIKQLSDHVNILSKEDGKERIGVAMLTIDPGTNIDNDFVKNNIIKTDRMVYIAHKTKQDIAAAVAGTIAGYEPSVSLLLKRVILNFTKVDPFIPFTPTEIATLNGPENNFGPSPSGATGKNGVNWLTSPNLLPDGIYMGESYTGDDSNNVKFIDVRRTIDDLSSRLKARLFRSIGTLRIGRSDLHSLVAQMEAVLDPFIQNDILRSYEVTIPLLTLLDKDPNLLTQSEQDQIHNAEAGRVVQVLVTVEYQAAIHRLAITLKFD